MVDEIFAITPADGGAWVQATAQDDLTIGIADANGLDFRQALLHTAQEGFHGIRLDTAVSELALQLIGD